MKYDLARFGLPGSSVGVNVNNNIFDREYVSSCYSEYACYWGAGRQLLPRRPSASNLSLWARFAVPFLFKLADMQDNKTQSDSTFTLNNLSFRVPGRTLLHPLSLTFPAGKVTGLIGHNGSSKSTLLKMLGRHQHRPRATFCWMTSRWRAGAVDLCPQGGLSAATVAAGGG